MSILDRLLARAGYNAANRLAAKELKQQGAGGKTMDTTDPGLVKFFQGSTYSGKAVTNDTAMRQSTVFTCTRIIAETYGSLPASVYEVDSSGNSTKIEDHPMAGLLFDSPNADMDGVEFGEALVSNIAVAGNGYSLINWRGVPRRSPITSLFPLPADAVLPKRNNDGTIVYKYNDRGRWEEVPQEMMWHVKGFGNNGLVGFSPVGYQRQMIGMALATEEFQAKFFANGAMPSWLINIPQWLTKPQREIARENIDRLWGGTENAYKAQLLEGGMQAVSATMPLQDAQFLELREATKTDIFGMYRVPPHMGGELKRSTNNNIEQQALEFVMYCMLPYLTRVEKSVSKWLFTPQERTRFRIRFNVEGLLRADAAARGALYSQLLQNGVLTRNEVRALEGRNRSTMSGMDDYTVQTALVPVDRLAAIADKQAAPTPAPVIAAPPKAQPILVQTVNQLPSNHMQINPPAVHTTVLAPEVTHKAGDVTVQSAAPSVVVQPVDFSGAKAALEHFGDLLHKLTDAMAADTELVMDEDGNAIGTRKKLPKGDQ